MNILIIPSWYPTADFPIMGIFIRDEALALSQRFSDSNFAISLWGSHDRSLWLDKSSWYKLPEKSKGLMKSDSNKKVSSNLVEYFSPAFTWTRKALKGNLNGIISANRKNLLAFQKEVGQIDIIHAHVSYPAGTVAQNLSKEFKIPYIITEHMGPFPFQSLKDSSGEPIDAIKKALNSSSAVVAASKFLIEKIAPYCSKPLTHIPNLVDTATFSSKSDRLKKKIIFVGRLEVEKGVQDLTDAWLGVSGQYPEWTLEFVGHGSLYKSVTHEQIVWSGEKTQADIVTALEEAAFLVLPSHLETFGKVIIEAMSMGMPVISTECGGPEETIDSTVGLLVPPQNGELLSNAIIKMIDIYQNYDPMKIRGLVESKYSARVVSNQIMDLYRRVTLSHM